MTHRVALEACVSCIHHSLLYFMHMRMSELYRAAWLLATGNPGA